MVNYNSMLARTDLIKIARGKLKDAAVLCENRRYDGASYICGYAVELTLKARICKTLKWKGYPESNSEFQNYQSFRTHDLNVLLHLTGREEFVKTNYMVEWSGVNEWESKSRYNMTGSVTKEDTQLMIASAEILLKKI